MPTLRPPPPGFVALVDVIPNLRLEIRYHTENNFTGAPVPGYAAPGAWLLVEAAEALARVQASLAPEGLGLYGEGADAAGLVAGHQAARLQDLEVLDHRRERHRVVGGELGGAGDRLVDHSKAMRSMTTAES